MILFLKNFFLLFEVFFDFFGFSGGIYCILLDFFWFFMFMKHSNSLYFKLGINFFLLFFVGGFIIVSNLFLSVIILLLFIFILEFVLSVGDNSKFIKFF